MDLVANRSFISSYKKQCRKNKRFFVDIGFQDLYQQIFNALQLSKVINIFCSGDLVLYASLAFTPRKVALFAIGFPTQGTLRFNNGKVVASAKFKNYVNSHWFTISFYSLRTFYRRYKCKVEKIWWAEKIP